jgi:hypothetical protein
VGDDPVNAEVTWLVVVSFFEKIVALPNVVSPMRADESPRIRVMGAGHDRKRKIGRKRPLLSKRGVGQTYADVRVYSKLKKNLKKP